MYLCKINRDANHKKTSSCFFCNAFATFNSEYFRVGNPFSIFAIVCGVNPALLASSAILRGIASRNCLTLFFFTILILLFNFIHVIGRIMKILKLCQVKNNIHIHFFLILIKIKQ